jgi:hypothetical protein
MNKTVFEAISKELRNSVNHDIVAYCDRLGSGRILEIAEQYGDYHEVVAVLEWLIGLKILVIKSDRVIRCLKLERDATDDRSMLDYLDHLESKLGVMPKSVDVADRLRRNEEARRKFRLKNTAVDLE